VTPPNARAVVGLRLLAPALEQLLGEPLRVESPCSLEGYRPHAGSSQPLSSSAARLLVGDAAVWVPAPETAAEPERGLAPLYRHARRRFVLPTVRLFTGPKERCFLGLDGWLLHAFERWRFPGKGGPSSLSERVSACRPEPKTLPKLLDAIALLIRYALFGSDRPVWLFDRIAPACPMWLRPVPDDPTPLALESARSLVVSASFTARFDSKGAELHRVPTTDLRAESYRIRPAGRDWGLDPVHTPEGADIRLTGRLGVGVAITDEGQLSWPGDQAPRSPSTARLPFAGYNDPRRLLLASNMQTHAMNLQGPELPLVRQDDRGAEPPGVNLAVGYIAWQGWNHEDAWVLSESAAQRLAAVEDTVQTIAIRSVELEAELLVKPGDLVAPGQALVRRLVAPGFLSASLRVLGRMPTSEPTVALRPEIGDCAFEGGTVVDVQTVRIDPATPLAAAFRTLHHIRLRRVLPLAVGDKLANRHGHKGIVGAILPDEDMPRWRGRALDALIDPISVLNRSNWGQVYETLAGALACEEGRPILVAGLAGPEVLSRVRALGIDEQGRSPVEPLPGRAVAGVQFVMRMPHHACDRLCGAPAREDGPLTDLRFRAQRFGEMDSWALWAHDCIVRPTPEAELTSAVRRLRRLLRAAGCSAEREGDHLILGRLDLSSEPPDEKTARHINPLKGTLGEAFDELEGGGEVVLVFDPLLTGVLPAWSGDERLTVRWLPVLPPGDRPARPRLDGSEEAHPLTLALRAVVRALRNTGKPAPQIEEAEAESGEPAVAAIKQAAAVHRALKEAYTEAVGLTATGAGSSKRAWLRRGVLGRRLRQSGRATVSPAGPLGLGLDEIGVPPALARALLGPGPVAGRRVWLKRDPVLHRWGLLAVRLRPVEGDTIRLPASLLGPLGADFDGDTVALFAELPGQPSDLAPWSPAALARHPLLGQAMFLPGKQYLYGLSLLLKNPQRRQALERELIEAGAPWPEDAASARDALERWVRAVPDTGRPNGDWWAVVERHALAALATDPGMGLGVLDADGLASLPVVACGAAKNLFGQGPGRAALECILRGRSLEVYRRRQEEDPAEDPIGEVMVAGKLSIGRFGGALRRLLYSPDKLSAADAERAQCLTERVTQQALSVKAGQRPLSYFDFDAQLKLLLQGKPADLAAVRGIPQLRAALEPLLPSPKNHRPSIWDELSGKLSSPPPDWLAWLRNPEKLAEVLAQSGGVLRLPLTDLRLSGWLESPRRN
jgi:hypothetical protein